MHSTTTQAPGAAPAALAGPKTKPQRKAKTPSQAAPVFQKTTHFSDPWGSARTSLVAFGAGIGDSVHCANRATLSLSCTGFSATIYPTRAELATLQAMLAELAATMAAEAPA